MAVMELAKNRKLCFLVSEEEGEGVRRIAAKVAKDVEKTLGMHTTVKKNADALEQAVLAVTAGSGTTARMMEERIPQLCSIKGKWEVYGFYLVENPCPGIKKGLVIYGSDRLGTIYGLFHLSELLGVSACCFWGDAGYPSYEKKILTTDKVQKDQEKEELYLYVENGISKEPSIKYRGFFINDEWPCYGTWTFSHFKGFTREMYDHIFEYLLRMKGNYLWPAMWTSSFLLDGPGMESMELADEYGIYIGMSHHEPCMRSSEEWDLVKGKESPYGEEWSYLTNKDGLLRYWEDGLKRCCGHQVFPTIGMRGERDSKMLGDDAQISENVKILKEILAQQRRLIRENLEQNGESYPLLFAVYKEVEDYYFGGGDGAGLKGCPELEGVTLMLCEDNFGNMRALPKKGDRNHKGGFGMYFHLDYHGGPCSYEWVASTPVSKIWEQMTQAYEYGIHDVWIVNAGDVKFQEYPLNFFMELAYDFETWGTRGKERYQNYIRQWTEAQFGSYTTQKEQEKIGWIQEEYIRLNALRRPESCNAGVYHPAHYLEGRKMLKRCIKLEQENNKMLEVLKKRSKEEAYYSMIYYPAAASANLLKMHLYAGMNHLYARQGKAIANLMGEFMDACIEEEHRLSNELHEFKQGKWAGMEAACHIGFTNWNSEDWRYPIKSVIRLPKQPRLVVSRADEEAHYTNQYFPIPLLVDDFQASDTEEVILEIANGGQGVLEWKIEETCPWLEFSVCEGKTALQEEVVLYLHREKLPEVGGAEFLFHIRSGEERVPVSVKAENRDFSAVPSGCFLPQKGIYVIPAASYAEVDKVAYASEEAKFFMLKDYGKFESGMKIFPVTASFSTDDERVPSVTYYLWAEKEGIYRAEIHTSPANPLVYGGILTIGLSCNEGSIGEVIFTDKEYKGGDNACAAWEHAVLIQEHIGESEVFLKKGTNRITLYAREAGIVLERVILYPSDRKIKTSYLGPEAGIQKKAEVVEHVIKI